MHAIRMDLITVAVAAVMAAHLLILVDVPILIPVDAHTITVTTIALVKMMTN